MATKKKTINEIQTEPATTGGAESSNYHDPQNLRDMLFLTDIPTFENNLINLADLFAASGLFGDKTPAQIAVQILAGQELGLQPVESMFDLRFDPPNKIEIKIMSFDLPPFRQMRNQLALLPKPDKTETKAPEFAICGLCRTHFKLADALPVSFSLADGGSVGALCCSPECQTKINRSFWLSANKDDLSARKNKNDTLPANEPKTASEPAKPANAPQICPQCLKEKDGLYYQADFDQGIYLCSPKCSINATQNFKAAKRSETKRIEIAPGESVVIETGLEKRTFIGTEGDKISASLEINDGEPDAIEAIDDPDKFINELLDNEIKNQQMSDEKEKSSLKDVLSKNPRNDVKPENTEPEPTGKDAEKVNIETPEADPLDLTGKDEKEIKKAVKVWRVQLNDYLSDLNISPDKIREKLAEYDSLLGWDSKAEKLRKCEQFYNEKLASLKKRLYDVLDDPAQFLSQPAARADYFAENLLKPISDKWSYADYFKLGEILEKDNILQKVK